jgi:hypothetical protein
MKQDGNYFWLEISGLEPQKEYALQYAVLRADGVMKKISDLYSEKVLHKDDQWEPKKVNPDLMDYPAQADGYVTVIQTAKPKFQWSEATLNFKRPDKNNLIIYEAWVYDHSVERTIEGMTNRMYYYEDLGKDASGKQIYGSMIYADFTGVTSLFSDPIATVKDVNGKAVKGMIDKGGFDFSKTENDLYVIGYLQLNDNDPAKTREYFKNLWGEDYDGYAAEYKLEEVLAGKYHGTGPDLTEEIKGYLSKMYSGSAKERVGCVPVDTRLAEILQLLMDKYTFQNVDHSWTKLCYYYDYLGPNG